MKNLTKSINSVIILVTMTCFIGGELDAMTHGTEKKLKSPSIVTQVFKTAITTFALFTSRGAYAQNDDSSFSNNALADVLSLKYNVKTTYNGSHVIMEGTKSELEKACNIFSNATQLRLYFLPPSQHTIEAKDSPTVITSMNQALDLIGIPKKHFEFINFEANDYKNGSYTIASPDKFKRGHIRLIIQQLKEESDFFNWLCQNLRQNFISDINGDFYKFTINYGILNQYLYWPPAKIESITSRTTFFVNDNLYSCALDADTIIKRLVAADGGSVYLELGNAPDEYTVHTLALGRNFGGRLSQRNISIALAFDVSGSMYGEPISMLNEGFPTFCKSIQNYLKLKDSQASVLLRVLQFNHIIKSETDHIITANELLPALHFNAGGGTDLTHIANLIIHNIYRHDVVIGFTDGEHTSGSLDESYEKLKDTQKNSEFARPLLFQVGSKKSDYFKFMGQIFGNSVIGARDIHTFINYTVNHINDIMYERKAFVFSIDGASITQWQPDQEAGIFRSSIHIRTGDSIKYDNVKIKVNPKTKMQEHSVELAGA